MESVESRTALPEGEILLGVSVCLLRARAILDSRLVTTQARKKPLHGVVGSVVIGGLARFVIEVHDGTTADDSALRFMTGGCGTIILHSAHIGLPLNYDQCPSTTTKINDSDFQTRHDGWQSVAFAT